MNIKQTIIAPLLFSIIFIGCGSKDKNKDDLADKEKNTLEENLSKLKKEASKLKAGSSIKSVALDGRNATITYVKDYKEYRALNPHSGISELDLENYWTRDDAIQKALIDGSVRIMKVLDHIDNVSIVLPFKETTYSISVDKTDLEAYIGIDFNTIKEQWDDSFSNPFVYDKEGRQLFFEQFGKEEFGEVVAVN